MTQIKEVERKAAAAAQAMRRAGGARDAPVVVPSRASQRPATAIAPASRGAPGSGARRAPTVAAHDGAGDGAPDMASASSDGGRRDAGVATTQIPRRRTGFARPDVPSGDAAVVSSGEPPATDSGDEHDGQDVTTGAQRAGAAAASAAAAAAVAAAASEAAELRDALAAAIGRGNDCEKRLDDATKVHACRGHEIALT